MADEVIPRRIAAAFYFFLILLGVLFYVGWSLLYNTWDISRPENVGVYALTILLVGFGATGYLLYRAPAKKVEPPQ